MNEQERKDMLRKYVRELRDDIVKAEHKLKEAQVRNQIQIPIHWNGMNVHTPNIDQCQKHIISTQNAPTPTRINQCQTHTPQNSDS